MVTDAEVQTTLTLLGYKHTVFNRGLIWRMEIDRYQSVGRRDLYDSYYIYTRGVYTGGVSAENVIDWLGG
jgi:hypothetical protein